jgi:hypothetical protein
MLDYRIHYAQLVIEDRLRQKRPTQSIQPATRPHNREASRQALTSGRR